MGTGEFQATPRSQRGRTTFKTCRALKRARVPRSVARFSTSQVAAALAEVVERDIVATRRTSSRPEGSGLCLFVRGDIMAPGACTAVGAYDISSGEQLTLVEVRKGTSWSIGASPDPSGAQGSGLSAVSCNWSNTCTAVGSYSDSTGGQIPPRTFCGSSWTIQDTPERQSGPTRATVQGVASGSTGSPTASGLRHHLFGDSCAVGRGSR